MHWHPRFSVKSFCMLCFNKDSFIFCQNRWYLKTRCSRTSWKTTMLDVKYGLSKQVLFGDRFYCIEMWDLPEICDPSRQVVSHGSGLSRKDLLYWALKFTPHRSRRSSKTESGLQWPWSPMVPQVATVPLWLLLCAMECQVKSTPSMLSEKT